MRILLTGIPNDTLQNMETIDPSFSLPLAIKPLACDKKELLLKTKRISNTGNYLIGEGSLHALRENEVTYIEPWRIKHLIKNPEFIDYARSHFDYISIATANMIRSDYTPTIELGLLKAVDLPVILLGVGIQRRGDLDKSIPPETIEFIEEIAKREHTVFTRGADSEQFLRDRGLKNVVATGCPSIYLSPENIRSSLVRLKELDIRTCTSISLNGYLGKDMSVITDVNSLATSTQSTFHYACQDEFLHYGLELRSEDCCYDPIYNKITGDVSYKGKDLLNAPLPLHLFHSTSNWRIWNSSKSLSLGYRFHGNLIAMQTATPSVIISVDDRMREMLAASGLPYIEMNEWYAQKDKAMALENFISSLNTAKILESYDLANEKFISAMVSAGIQSRLQ